MSDNQPDPTSRRSRTIRWVRNGAIAVAVLLVLFGLFGYFVAPGLIQSTAEKQIAEQTGRKATIGAIEFSPYRLAASIRDFKLYEADGTTIAVQVDVLLVDISSASIVKRALVFDAIKLTHPQISVTRFEPQRFSFSDIVDRILAKPKSDDETRFSLNNIEVENGSIAFEDRVTGRKHVIDQLKVGVPFLSNLPYDTDLFVTPAFSARVNGSTIALDGRAQLFAAQREATLELDIAGLDLPTYVDFAPTPLPVKVVSGKLDAKLALRFKAAVKDAKGVTTPQSLAIAGPVTLADLKVTDTTARELLTAKRLVVDAESLEPLANAYAIKTVVLTEPRVRATRRKDGSIDLATLFAAPATKSAAPASATKASPVRISVGSIRVDGANALFIDETLAPVETTTFDRIGLKVDRLSLAGDTPTAYALSFSAPGEGTVEAAGTVVLTKKTVTGTASLKGFRPGAFSRYLATFVAARVGDGSIDASAHYTIDASGPAIVGRIDQIQARIDKLRSQLPNEKSSFVAADAVVLANGAYDFQKRAFTGDALTLTAPVIAISRDAKGKLNLQAVLVDKKPEPTAQVSAPKDAAVVIKPADTQAFSAEIKAFTIERGNVSFDDASTPTPVRVRASPFNLKAENVGTAAGATVPFSLDAVVNQRGKLSVQGKAVVAPLSLEATVATTRLPVGWLAAYAGERLNIVVEDADLDLRGAVRVRGPKAGAGKTTDASSVSYRGSVGVTNVRAIDRVTSEEFIRWKKLDIPTLDFEMPARAAPFAATIGRVSLDDFYARVIVNANGRLNVQDVVSTGEQRSVTTPEDTAPAGKPIEAVAVEREKGRTTAVVPAASTGPKPQIKLAGIKLTNGRVGITDNFIRPNYSANLTGLNGEVSSIDSSDAKPADVKIVGTIDGDGKLDIGGRVNLFAFTTLTDIAAEAKDIELTRLTPYAIKYAGYAIQRGKLSMTVKYRIVDGKLDAENRLFLDQLTFGEKVESPTATKLPVLLAVSLLKNSRGEIDINLPISGSLSDPQFSIGGVIVRVIVNLLTRAITSPFALLGAAVGGGGGSEELGYVEFEAGVSDMTADGKKRVEALAKALSDRPALKLDIIGRYDPATDGEGIKRDHLLDRLKDLKAKDLTKDGTAGNQRVGRDDVKIDPAERDALLARVYDDTKLPDKPRNAIGLAKTVPVAEMERLLLANMKLDANDPRWLAEARADVVRHFIEDTGKVSPSRVFLVTPKLDAGGIRDGRPNRVDFALR